ncbi:hypothetical protein IEO21_09298 [Rhodonia placenta]|uniref:MFS general substrate transporter n=1 Tax=Rhodonia placenta TaxID=104341 RepID=A0A8H7TXW3_9APHY|nr:hypothetical protein IEO21_09298 [Postia placenta]
MSSPRTSHPPHSTLLEPQDNLNDRRALAEDVTHEQNPPETVERPYSVYTTGEKWFIVMMSGLAAMFSTFTANIYFPAIPTIATAFHKSTEDINLTVTVYMIVQGVYAFKPLGPPALSHLVGPCLGPVLGGLLSQGLGWRLMPETLRAFVGDGSIPPPRFYSPLIPIVGRSRPRSYTADASTRPPPTRFRNPLRLFLYPDITFLLIFTSVIYAVFYGVNTSISTLFATTYPYLSETEIGLCFLAIGGGMLVGGLVNGKLVDMQYRRVQRRLALAAQKENDPEKSHNMTKEDNFPIVRTRLQLMPIYVAVFIATCACYGWTLDKRATIAAPLVLQFILGWVTVSTMNITQTILVDLAPGQGASVTACYNLVRCGLGAALVSVIDIIIDHLGVGWTCTVVLWTTLESATHRTTSGYGEYTVVDRAGICCSVALYLVFYGLFQFLRVPIVVSILNRCAEKGNVMQQAKPKPILIDLPSQSIHFGKVGQKLTAGVGSGAETATGSRSESGY